MLIYFCRHYRISKSATRLKSWKLWPAWYKAPGFKSQWRLKSEASAGNKAWHDRLSITCGRDRRWHCQEGSSTQQLRMDYAQASLHQPAVKENQLSETPDFPCAWMNCSPRPSLGLVQKTILCLFLTCPLTYQDSYQHDVVFSPNMKSQPASAPGVMVRL